MCQPSHSESQLFCLVCPQNCLKNSIINTVSSSRLVLLVGYKVTATLLNSSAVYALCHFFKVVDKNTFKYWQDEKLSVSLYHHIINIFTDKWCSSGCVFLKIYVVILSFGIVKHLPVFAVHTSMAVTVDLTLFISSV